MKKLIITSVLAVLTALTTTVGAQNYPKEYLGLPGDNLNLYAVMDLFRNSKTLEAFERGLNDLDSRVNNLDLNGDYRVDYITVSDYRDGRVHNIVLRAMLGRNEYQDVAVITVEKLRRNKVMIQIIGDVALYGRNYIIEPGNNIKNKFRYYNGPSYYGNVTVINNYYNDLWDWPVVMYIYNPHYMGWSSSWYWGYYPEYWAPWSPYYWDYYYGYHSGWNNHYYRYYNQSNIYRYSRYNDFYYHSVRQQSPQVHHRIAEGNYRQTYSRPELRTEGVELSRRTREAVVSGTRIQDPAEARMRREAPSQSVSGTAPAASVDGRRPAASTDGRRPAASTDGRRPVNGSELDKRSAGEVEAGRRAPATVSRSTEGNMNNAVIRDQTRRSSVATESKATEVRAAENRATEARATESRAAESRAAQVRASEERAAQQRVADERASQARESERRATEVRAAESRATEARATESRAAENRATEARAAESRAAESRSAENRATEARAAENKAAESRAAESRAAESRAAESRAAQVRASKERAAQQRVVDERASQARAAETARSEAARVKNSESSTERIIRK